MMNRLNPRVQQIQISGIRRFSNLVAQVPDAISLTIGQPDFPTPEHVKLAGQQAIDENRTVYTPNAGLPALRDAASDFLASRYGLTYDSATEIITTCGASEAIDIALRTILTEGSEVILPAPVYPGYDPLIRLAGATPVYVDTSETQFKLTAAAVREKLSPRTSCVILPYPSNPTGAVLSQDELRDLADVLRDAPVFVLSDEIYSELVYGETVGTNPVETSPRDPKSQSASTEALHSSAHHSIAAFPGMREKTVIVNGLSKSHAMTGWRIGFTFAPAYITEQMLKVHQYQVSCASSISQYAALEALTNGQDDAGPMRAAYRDRRDYVHLRLNAMGLSTELPGGAFYVFPSIRPFGLSSFDFASRLLYEGHVALVPGSAFSDAGEGFVRLSYAYSMDTLTEGLNRIERFIQTLR